MKHLGSVMESLIPLRAIRRKGTIVIFRTIEVRAGSLTSSIAPFRYSEKVNNVRDWCERSGIDLPQLSIDQLEFRYEEDAILCMLQYA